MLARKRKKEVETIKFEGLTSDSIREFEPKEDTQEEDALWEEYFKGSPNLLQFPNAKLEETAQEDTTATEVTAVTQATTVTNASAVIKPKKRKSKKENYVTLDSTHTKSEQMVYSIMYRETITKGKTANYFSLRKLMKMTGIGSDKTVFNALKGLRNKLSIQMVEHSNNKPTGTLYGVFPPKDIFKLRSDNGLIIDINTKRIVTTAVTEATSVIGNAAATKARATQVTTVENTEVGKGIPYIKGNSNKIDDSLKIESSSEDEVLDHKKYIISFYEKYTGNKWRTGDNKFYEKVKQTIPDVLEAGVISSVLRSKAKIKAFAYCEGVINEFNDNFPPGYLIYLREKWKEIKEEVE